MTRVFSDTFEDTLAKWTGSILTAGCSVAGNNTTYPHHGKYGFNSYVPLGVAANSYACVYKTLAVTTYRHMYARIENFVFDQLPEDNGDIFYMLGFWQDLIGGPPPTSLSGASIRFGVNRAGATIRFIIRFVSAPATFNQIVGTQTPVINKKYCVEIECFEASGTGYVKAWINNNLEISSTGLDNDDYYLKLLVLGEQNGVSPDLTNLNMYADCFVADTENRIMCECRYYPETRLTRPPIQRSRTTLPSRR